MKILAFSFMIGVLVLTANTAFACQGKAPPNCSCKNNQWINNTTNNVYNSTTNNNQKTVNGISGNVSATGGKSTATGGNVSNSGNSTNTLSANNNGSGNTLSTGSSTSNVDINANGAGANNGNGSNNTSITSNVAASKIPVSTAYSAGLTSGLDTCLGSISGGGQTSFLGLTIGGTKRDKSCEHIKNAHLIAEFNREAACVYVLKNIPGAAEAFNSVGATCAQPPVNPIVQTPQIDVVTHEELREVEQRIITHVSQK